MTPAKAGTPDEFTRHFQSVRARTERLLQLVPPGDLEWRAAPAAFSFGDIFRHLAGTERWMWAETVSGRRSRYPGHGEHLAAGADAIQRYFQTLHAEAMEIFGRLTPDSFTAPVVTPAGTPLPAWKWLRAMVEHEAHHRGQLYLMLRMRGVPTPPLFGLTSEQVQAAPQGRG